MSSSIWRGCGKESFCQFLSELVEIQKHAWQAKNLNFQTDFDTWATGNPYNDTIPKCFSASTLGLFESTFVPKFHVYGTMFHLSVEIRWGMQIEKKGVLVYWTKGSPIPYLGSGCIRKWWLPAIPVVNVYWTKGTRHQSLSLCICQIWLHWTMVAVCHIYRALAPKWRKVVWL